MLNCLVVDDEPLALNKMASYVQRIPFLNLIDSCSNATDVIKIMSEQSIDLIFLDVDMPDISGIELVRSMRNRPMIIFTTAYREYAVEAFKIEAVDYLLKPFSFEDMLRSADKALHVYNLNHREAEAPIDNIYSKEEECIFIKSDYKIVRIYIKDICYLESMSEYVKIFIEGKDKPIITLITMKRLEDVLPSSVFMRVHRSFLVNLFKVKEISRMRIVMDKEVYIPVGESYKEQFNDFINKRYVGKD